MPLTSMTGFARADGDNVAARWHWELRSVNGKGLDVRFRLPAGFEGMEARLREELARHMKRGNVQATLTLDRLRAAMPLRVNEDALAVVIAAMKDLGERIELMPPRPEGVLALKGVLEMRRGRRGRGRPRRLREGADRLLRRSGVVACPRPR